MRYAACPAFSTPSPISWRFIDWRYEDSVQQCPRIGVAGKSGDEQPIQFQVGDRQFYESGQRRISEAASGADADLRGTRFEPLKSRQVRPPVGTYRTGDSTRWLNQKIVSPDAPTGLP